MLVTVSNLELIHYINETNMSVKHLADVLSEKTRSSSWVVVFKALVTVHHLTVHGNEVSMLYIQMVIISNWKNVLGLAKAYHLLLSIVTSRGSNSSGYEKADFFQFCI